MIISESISKRDCRVLLWAESCRPARDPPFTVVVTTQLLSLPEVLLFQSLLMFGEAGHSQLLSLWLPQWNAVASVTVDVSVRVARALIAVASNRHTQWYLVTLSERHRCHFGGHRCAGRAVPCVFSESEFWRTNQLIVTYSSKLLFHQNGWRKVLFGIEQMILSW